MAARRLTLREALGRDALEELRGALAGGGVLGIPTDTRYGLAADPFSEAGVERIYAMKGRPALKAMPVVVADLAQLESLGAFGPKELLDRLRALWPAPLTVVLQVARPFAATAGLSSVAVRVPAQEELRDFLRAVGPLTATSANRSGEEPASSALEVADLFGGDLDYVLDGGPSPPGPVSTLLDGTVTPPRILRAGAFPWL